MSNLKTKPPVVAAEKPSYTELFELYRKEQRPNYDNNFASFIDRLHTPNPEREARLAAMAKAMREGREGEE